MNEIYGSLIMRTLMLLLLLGPCLPAAAQVYRTVDEHGNVVFSDKPSPGAEEVQIREVQTIPPEKVEDAGYTPKPEKAASPYTEVAITRPENDATLRDNPGNVNVSVTVSPRLQGGDTIVLYMDGDEVATGGPGFTLQNVDRGTHSLRAGIRGQDGELRASSTSVTFHLFRESIQHPPPHGATPPPKPAGTSK